MKHLLSILVVISMAGGACWYAAAVPQQPAGSVNPATLIPQGVVLFAQCDGVLDHMPAIRQTAKWKSFDKSGLRARVSDLLEMLASVGGPDAARLVRTTLDDLHQYGLSLGIAMTAEDQPLGLSPYGVIVFHGAGDLKHELMTMLFELNRPVRRTVETRIKSGRQMSLVVPPEGPLPGLEVALWAEGEHLVLAAGVNASDRVLAMLDRNAPNITESQFWNDLRRNDGFTVNQLGWIDTQTLATSLESLPLPPLPSGEQVGIRDALDILGLANLKAITMRSGYRGEVTWDRVDVISSGPRTGLLALMNQRNMTLAELPPMPPALHGFLATTFNIPEAVDTILETVGDGLALVDPNTLGQFERGVGQFTQMLGEPRDVLAAGLGDVFCAYSEPGMLPFGFSPVLTASVRDRQKLTGALDLLSQIRQAIPGLKEVTVKKRKKDSGTWYTIAIPNVPVFPTILVTNDWLMVSLTPGAAQALTKRLAGGLAAWEPGPEHQSALADLPAEYSSIMVMDPQPGYERLMSFVPIGLGLLKSTVLPELSRETGVEIEMPFDMEDMPLPDEITGPMFPNISVGLATASGISFLSRKSVPLNPFGIVGTTAMVPMLVPLLKSASESERRTRSRNHLRQLGLAMHNYHDAYGRFPGGTVENDNLKPEERLGWAVSILPFMDQANMYNSVQMEAGWEDQEDFVKDTTIPSYLNPSMPRGGMPGGQIDYLAMTGVGPDAASLDDADPNAGIFGYRRKTRIRSITDGTSNTIMLANSAEPVRYLQGSETMSGLSEKPYINGPDGFGSPHAGGMHVLLADGSVRFVSESIDSTVMEALATKAGGEIVSEF